MEYSVRASSESKKAAFISIKKSDFQFGITPESGDTLANPAELFLSSFAACILKNLERFSGLLRFEYESAEILVSAIRIENPPRMDDLNYELKILSQDDRLNVELLKKNIEKFGTIFNTVKSVCSVQGEIIKFS